jgi:DNA-binding NarL/FixJ family response regulator
MYGIQKSEAPKMEEIIKMTPNEARLRIKRLTDRQLTVLCLLMLGYSYKEIATILSIERKTVRVHVTHIRERLETLNLVQTVIVMQKAAPCR